MAVTRNLMEGVSFNVTPLPTDAEKLDFGGGFVKSVGGIIKAYQNTAEENAFAGAQQALDRSIQDGDSEVARNLVGYSQNAFTNPELRAKLRAAAIDVNDAIELGKVEQRLNTARLTGDTTELDSAPPVLFNPSNKVKASQAVVNAQDDIRLTGFTNSIIKAKNAGDIDALETLSGNVKFTNQDTQRKALEALQQAKIGTAGGYVANALAQAQNDSSIDPLKASLQRISSLQIPPEERAKLVNAVTTGRNALLPNIMAREAYTDYTSAAETPENQQLIAQVLQENPQFSSILALNANGVLTPVPIVEDEITQRIAAANPKDAQSDLVAKTQAEINRVRSENQKLQVEAAKAFKDAGVVLSTQSKDSSFKKVFNKLASDGSIPLEVLQSSLDKAKNLFGLSQTLNPETQAYLAAEEAKIDAQFELRKQQDKELKDIVLKSGVTPKTFEEYKKEDSVLQTSINGISSDTTVGFTQDNREDLLDFINKDVRTSTFEDASGKTRVATPVEIAKAIDANKESQAFSWVGDGLPTINADQIKKYVADVVKQNRDTDPALQTDAMQKVIKDYYTRLSRINNDQYNVKQKLRNDYLTESNKPVIQSLYSLLSKPNPTTSNVNVGGKDDPARIGNNLWGYQDTSGKLVQFQSVDQGLDAAIKRLERYGKGLVGTKSSPAGVPADTIREVMDKWRPEDAIKGKTGYISQKNYYDSISKDLGIGIDEPIPQDKDSLAKLAWAIAKVEQPRQLSAYQKATEKPIEKPTVKQAAATIRPGNTYKPATNLDQFAAY